MQYYLERATRLPVGGVGMWLTDLVGGSGAKGRRQAFEVQVFKTDHWVIESVCTSEAEARELARKLLPNREGVRIVREYNGSSRDGASAETIIFSEMRQVNPKAVVVPAIEEAPLCTDAKQYLGGDSRRVVTKLLKQYLEQRGLTASEVLCHPAEMKRAMNFENMVPSAVSRVATVQAKAAGVDVRDRREAIYDSLSDLRVRAEAAARLNLPSAAKQGLPALLARAEAVAEGDPVEADYLAKVALCRDTLQVRNLLGKVEWLLETCGESQPFAAVDALVADALGFPAVVQDLLARQPDLGTALSRLIDILDGTFEGQKQESAPAITTVLSRWIGSGGAPETWAVLLDFLLRSLRGTNPLSRDPEQARARFRALLQRMLRLDHVLGGSEAAEAMTAGYLRFIEQGGAEGRRISIDGVLHMVESPRDKLVYLLALAGSPLGQREVGLVLARAQALLGHGHGVNTLTAPQTPLKQKMQMMAGLYRAVLASGLPPADRDALADRVDTMVADYIVQAKVIEKLDDPAASLRVRATRLMQFAAADVLASPKARRMVRDQIIGHLRQPNFDGKYVEGLTTPEEKAAAIKGFYELLRQAKFV